MSDLHINHQRVIDAFVLFYRHETHSRYRIILALFIIRYLVNYFDKGTNQYDFETKFQNFFPTIYLTSNAPSPPISISGLKFSIILFISKSIRILKFFHSILIIIHMWLLIWPVNLIIPAFSPDHLLVHTPAGTKLKFTVRRNNGTMGPTTIMK